MVVVTGGLGFIGNELVRQLKERGEEVVILDNKNRVAPKIQDIDGVPLVKLDVTDASVSAFFKEVNPQTVFHLAAIHYIPECNGNPERTLRVNVEGTQSVLRACAAAGVSKFVFASSGAVYADSGSQLTEESPIAPVDIYGWSKLFGERLCEMNYSLNGTPAVVCRLFNNYGPRETNPHIIPEILNQLKSGTNRLKLGNIATVRDYIHTSDCATALIKLADRCDGGVNTFNVASECGYSVRQIIDLLSELSGRDIKIDFDGARTRKFDKQKQVASISKLEEFLGWRPATRIEDGLRDLLEFEGLI